jgi:hypothetical protein
VTTNDGVISPSANSNKVREMHVMQSCGDFQHGHHAVSIAGFELRLLLVALPGLMGGATQLPGADTALLSFHHHLQHSFSWLGIVAYPSERELGGRSGTV